MSYGLYIHIPFCVRKCKYCDFVSFTGQTSRFSQYVDRVIKEMNNYPHVSVDTVYIGGGTPSVLSDYDIKRLMNACYENFDILNNAQISIEANPKTVNDSKLSVMLESGINRISIGVQSFVDEELEFLGRIHNAKEASDTIESAKRAGFKNINIDLMSGLPNQTLDTFKTSLDIAAEHDVEHISCYSLILEEGTPLYDAYKNNAFSILDDDTDREIYSFTKRYLQNYGFNRYEISNYAKEGYESKHNLKYWHCDEYIGLGVAAHSYVNNERYSNTTDLNKYLSCENTVCEKNILTKTDAMEEFVIMGLRTSEGICEDEFYRRFKKNLNDVYGTVLDKFIKSEHMQRDQNRYFLTDKGIDVSNSVMCEFIIT